MIYDRFARDASEGLFNSIYSELYKLAEREQAEIYAASRGKGRKRRAYFIGERQQALTAFSANKLSVGAALDILQTAKAPPLRHA